MAVAPDSSLTKRATEVLIFVEPANAVMESLSPHRPGQHFDEVRRENLTLPAYVPGGIDSRSDSD
jgi:hypothetical protein